MQSNVDITGLSKVGSELVSEDGLSTAFRGHTLAIQKVVSYT